MTPRHLIIKKTNGITDWPQLTSHLQFSVWKRVDYEIGRGLVSKPTFFLHDSFSSRQWFRGHRRSSQLTALLVSLWSVYSWNQQYVTWCCEIFNTFKCYLGYQLLALFYAQVYITVPNPGPRDPKKHNILSIGDPRVWIEKQLYTLCLLNTGANTQYLDSEVRTGILALYSSKLELRSNDQWEAKAQDVTLPQL